MTIRTRALAGGPAVTAGDVVFRFPDPAHRLAGVRLSQDVRIPGDQLDFAPADGGWSLTLPRPSTWRMEYRIELRHDTGDGVRTEEVCDPANPLRAPGAFGEKSVLEFPGLPAAGLA